MYKLTIICSDHTGHESRGETVGDFATISEKIQLARKEGDFRTAVVEPWEEPKKVKLDISIFKPSQTTTYARGVCLTKKEALEFIESIYEKEAVK